MMHVKYYSIKNSTEKKYPKCSRNDVVSVDTELYLKDVYRVNRY